MALNQIINQSNNYDSIGVPPNVNFVFPPGVYKNLEVNTLKVNSIIALNTIILNSIQANINLAILQPGLEGQFIRTSMGLTGLEAKWHTLQAGDINSNVLNSVLVTGATGIVQFSNSPVYSSLVLQNDLTVNDDCILNSVSLLDLSINNVKTPNSVLGLDNLNNLVWVPQILPQLGGTNVYHALNNFDINQFGSSYIQYSLPSYSGLGLDIIQQTNQIFEIATAGNYQVVANVCVLASASDQTISFILNGSPAGDTCVLNPASSFAQVKFFGAMSIGDLISVQSFRNGLATPKLTLPQTSSPITFTRIL